MKKTLSDAHRLSDPSFCLAHFVQRFVLCQIARLLGSLSGGSLLGLFLVTTPWLI